MAKSKKEKEPKFLDVIQSIYGPYTVGPQQVKTVHNMAVLSSICQFGKNNGRGPIGVAKCLLNGKEEVTLLLLGGLEFKKGQATRMLECTRSVFGLDNDYLKNLVDVFKRCDKDGNPIIPKDKPLIVAGISLGGMIAQQILQKDEIVNNYNIKSILCYGSPLNMSVDRKGVRVVRFSDEGDPVTTVSKPFLRLRGVFKKTRDQRDAEELILVNGHYGNPIKSHAYSYVSNKDFDPYDFYGEKAGTNTLDILEGITFYDDPIIKKHK